MNSRRRGGARTAADIAALTRDEAAELMLNSAMALLRHAVTGNAPEAD